MYLLTKKAEITRPMNNMTINAIHHRTAETDKKDINSVPLNNRNILKG
jgi:hypothetical protein